MRPGIYPDLDIEKYHRSEGISKTGLCLIDEAPATYRYQCDHRGEDDDDETDSLTLGKALHAAMEGAFHEMCAVGPDVRRNSNAWKEFLAKNPGKICLKPEQAKLALGMKEAIWNHRRASAILSEAGRFEVSFYWIDEETGLLCKCRPDWLSADLKTVVDFKTARSAVHAKFQNAAYDLHYYVSAAMTLEGIYKTTGILPERYIFIVPQPKPPHLTSAFEATAEEIEEGEKFLRRNLTLLKRCIDNGAWPGLPDEILPLGLPRRARYQAQEYSTGHEIEEKHETEPGKWW